MSETHVLLVIGTTSHKGSTRVVAKEAARLLADAGCAVDTFDYEKTPLPLFNPDSSWGAPDFAALKARVERADVMVLCTPDYHGSMSSALKNFLDHFWKEYAGKLFASVVGSFDKGLTVHDQVRTVARQCYAWALPYGVTFSDKEDVQDGAPTEAFRQRLAMLARDVRVYGALLAGQRRADLAGTDPGFMARLRK
jgi:NAD(P)H-dependent FMN reductase